MTALVFVGLAVACVIAAYLMGRDDARIDRAKLATVRQQRNDARVRVINLRAKVASLQHGRDVLQHERIAAYAALDDVAAIAGDWDRDDVLLPGPTVAKRLRRAVAPRERETAR